MFCAYDFETTRIESGTPTFKYLTVYGQAIQHSVRLTTLSRRELCKTFRHTLFRDDRHRMRYVAWNGNRFDALLLIRTIVESDPTYIVRPYLTRSGMLRGAQIVKGKYWWELLDGMSMLGMDAAGGWPLRRFLELYAPEYPKGTIDWETVDFDPDKADHVAYAERDSEGLYHALCRADDTLRSVSGRGLQVTIGNAGIKFFQREMPDDTLVWDSPSQLVRIIHEYVMRGGYCYTHRRYRGPLWQADMNQAYAAAMRDAELPCGSCMKTYRFNPRRPGIYAVTIRKRDGCPIPFYCKDGETGDAVFCLGETTRTYLTSSEIKVLRSHHWKVKVHYGWYWTNAFNCRAMVERLELLRRSDVRGPNGPVGTIAKYLGCASYGKTVERVDRSEVVVSRTCPDGFTAYKIEDSDYRYFWFRMVPELAASKVYHRPQLGAFITAHVRMKVWEAALASADTFVKCDTDSVAFSAPIHHLTIDPIHYGDWKMETNGQRYIVIAKKVYCAEDGSSFKAKGLNLHPRTINGMKIAGLSVKDFEAWFDGQAPEQLQLQKRSFRRFLAGEAMFATQKRRGTNPKIHSPGTPNRS